MQGTIPLELEFALDKFTEDMNPQNVDISALINRFRKFAATLADIDFGMYGKFLMFCTALLKVKFEKLFGIGAEEDFYEEPGNMEQEHADYNPDATLGINYNIPKIEIPVRRAPKVKITINDLKRALKEAFKLELKREERWEKRKEAEYGINLNRPDIKQKIESFFKTLLAKLNIKEEISFEEVLDKKDRAEKVEKFANLLFLESDEKIRCIQKEFLGKLLIKMENRGG